MASTSRLLVAQIALGAAFGAALAWKTARVRRPGLAVREVPRRAAMQLAAEMPAPYRAAVPRPAERAPAPPVRQAAAANPSASVGARSFPARVRAFSSAVRASFPRLPEPAGFAIVIGTAALIPILVGVTYVMTRTDSTPPARPHAVASVPASTVPTAVATPGLAGQLLDARRELDLASVLDAANAYATLFGAYPSTANQLSTLCLNPTDAGCAIAKYATHLAVSDGQFAYWYASDGRSLTLLARVETTPSQNDCPSALPPSLAGVPVFCLRGTIGTQ